MGIGGVGGDVPASKVSQPGAQQAAQKPPTGRLLGRKVTQLGKKEFFKEAKASIDNAVKAPAQTVVHSAKTGGKNTAGMKAKTFFGIGKAGREASVARSVCKQVNSSLNQSLKNVLGNKGRPNLRDDRLALGKVKDDLEKVLKNVNSDSDKQIIQEQLNRCNQLLKKAEIIEKVGVNTESLSKELSTKRKGGAGKAVGLAKAQKALNELKSSGRSGDPAVDTVVSGYALRAQSRLNEKAKSVLVPLPWEDLGTQLAKSLVSVLYQDPPSMKPYDVTQLLLEMNDRPELDGLVEEFTDQYGWSIGEGSPPENLDKADAKLLHDNITFMAGKVYGEKNPKAKLEAYTKLLDLYQTSKNHTKTPHYTFKYIRDASQSFGKKTSPEFKQQELRRLMIEGKTDSAVKHLLKMNSEGIEPKDPGVWKELEGPILKELGSRVADVETPDQYMEVMSHLQAAKANGVSSHLISEQIEKLEGKQMALHKSAMSVLTKSGALNMEDEKILTGFVGSGKVEGTRHFVGGSRVDKPGEVRFKERVEKMCKNAAKSKDPSVLNSVRLVLMNAETRVRMGLADPRDEVAEGIRPYMSALNSIAKSTEVTMSKAYVSEQVALSKTPPDIVVKSTTEFTSDVSRTIQDSSIRMAGDGLEIKGADPAVQEFINQQYKVGRGYHETVALLIEMKPADKESAYILNQYIEHMSKLANVYDVYVDDILSAAKGAGTDQELFVAIRKSFDEHSDALFQHSAALTTLYSLGSATGINSKLGRVFPPGEDLTFADRVVVPVQQAPRWNMVIGEVFKRVAKDEEFIGREGAFLDRVGAKAGDMNRVMKNYQANIGVPPLIQ